MLEVEGAVSQLAHFHEDPDMAIHELRKHSKRIRSVLLLARPILDAGGLSRTNRLVRDAARLFSEARDSFVLQDTCDKLAARFPDAGELFRTVRSVWAVRHAESLQDRELPEKVSRASDAFYEAGENIERWHWNQITYETVLRAVLSNYTLGCSDFDQARRSRDPEDCHDWRKRAKALSYHLTLLAPLDSQEKEGIAKQALACGELASSLGEHHDLAVFESAIVEDREHGISRMAADLVRSLAAQRRSELEELIFAEGKVVYDVPAEDWQRRFAAVTRAIV